jgi:hypothetical protein
MLQSIEFKRKTNASLTLYLSGGIILSSVAFSQAQTYKFDFGIASVAAVTGGAFQWKEMDGLPPGMYKGCIIV